MDFCTLVVAGAASLQVFCPTYTVCAAKDQITYCYPVAGSCVEQKGAHYDCETPEGAHYSAPWNPREYDLKALDPKPGPGPELSFTAQKVLGVRGGR